MTAVEAATGFDDGLFSTQSFVDLIQRTEGLLCSRPLGFLPRLFFMVIDIQNFLEFDHMGYHVAGIFTDHDLTVPIDTYLVMSSA